MFKAKTKDLLHLLFLIIVLLSIKVESLKCGDENIDHCIKCGENERYNRCQKCEEKYFLSSNNLFCVPCDDGKNGQPGCAGSCDASDHALTRNVYCDICKDGYVNMKRICVKCDIQQDHCFKCQYDNEKELDGFKYTKCYDDYILYNGLCIDCIAITYCQVALNAILKKKSLFVMNAILFIY